MRITYDELTDAAYIHIADESAEAVAESGAKVHVPGSATKTYAVHQGFGAINLDFDSRGHLIGIEVLEARKQLPAAAIREAMRL
jgi:uncharacterized protein YuzE